MEAMPVGLSRDLPPAQVMRAQVEDQHLVVWRAPDGAIAAWDNRCPHRGMALSHGFVRCGMLACLYHGWHFGPDGQCKVIPAHPGLEPPNTIRARIFSVLEAAGVIWVSIKGEAKAPDLPDGFAPLRTLEISAPPETVTAATMATPFQGNIPSMDGDDFVIGASRLKLLFNPLGPRGTQVVVLIGTSAGSADFRAMSRWCEAMRRKAEDAE